MSHRPKIKPSIKPKAQAEESGEKIVKDGFEMIVYKNKQHTPQSESERKFLQELKEKEERENAFYDSNDCIDLDFFVRMTDYLLYGANYFIGQSVDIIDKHGLKSGRLCKLIKKVADAYIPLYKYMVDNKSTNRCFVENDEEMRNKIVTIAERLIDEPRKQSYMLL